MTDPAPRRGPESGWRVVAAGAAALLLALPLAATLVLLRTHAGALPVQQVVARVVIALAGMFVIPVAGFLIWRRRSLDAGSFGLLVLATVATLLVTIYLYSVESAVRFPADILLWSEGDFVSDIIKLHVGHSLYTAPANIESFTYTPGSQILTSAIARAVGAAEAIPVFRAIQLGYLALAALFATLACRRVVSLSGGGSSSEQPLLWGAVWTAVFFLIGGNSITSPFIHLLHNDALALLMSAVGYYLLVEFVATGHAWLLLPMALLPGVGFFVKQSLAVWAGIYTLFLVIWERRLGWGRLGLFGLTSFGSVALAVAGCYLVWGHDFIYWTFQVMGNHHVSPLRSAQHVLFAWAYFAAGLAGGLVLLDWKEFDRWTGLWLVALGLLAVEAYTSGIAWMLNHMGPGSVLCGIWLLAALTRAWPSLLAVRAGAPFLSWARGATALAVAILATSGLGIFRVPTPVLAADATRYIGEIEREFAGQPADRVLLDYGSWVYVHDGVVMKDHAAPIGEAGYTGTADFSGILQRINTRYYTRILMRNFDSPEFTYDYMLWPRSSGIKAALEANYRVVRRIGEVQGQEPNPPWFKTISVLEPRTN
jgi:hypothetical protein